MISQPRSQGFAGANPGGARTPTPGRRRPSQAAVPACTGRLRPSPARPRPSRRRPRRAAARAPGWRTVNRARARPPMASGHEGVAPVGEGGDEHGAGEQRRPRPQDEHGAAVAVAELEQAVVEVLLVGGGHAGAPGRPADDGEDGVEDRHAEDHERDEQRGEEEERLARVRRRRSSRRPTSSTPPSARRA